MLALRPAPVPAHDDRHVPRQPCHVQLAQQLRLFRSDRPQRAGVRQSQWGMRFQRPHAFVTKFPLRRKVNTAARACAMLECPVRHQGVGGGDWNIEVYASTSVKTIMPMAVTHETILNVSVLT